MPSYSYKRSARVRELLRREVGDLIERDLKDPRVGFVTVTDAEVTEDLREATIWISVYGQEEERQAALTGLQSAAPYIQHRIGEQLRLKRIPHLRFALDRSIQRAQRIEEILRELREGGELGAGEKEGERG